MAKKTKEQIQLEALYLQAKEAYYAGEEIMSDAEFDELEETLREMGSEVVEIVGTTSDRTQKYPHLSMMCSLAKHQATLAGVPPLEQMKKWFTQFPVDTEFEGSPKFDGNAINHIYKTGRYLQTLSRGDKEYGKDLTPKFINKVPKTLKGITGDVEIRCEAILSIANYLKYKAIQPEIKNSRNFVAGMLNTDQITESTKDIEFLPVEVRLHDGDYDFPKDTQTWLTSQNLPVPFTIKFKAIEFEKVYWEMKAHRENDSLYQLDGFVVKAPEHMRKEMGDTGHHPNWAIAIKFPPQEARTTVKDYRFTVGTTGEITPIIRLNPIDLDGTTIQNTAGFNLGYIIREKLYPGAEVTIVKSGDIIPIIAKVNKPGNEKLFHYPLTCPVCGTPTVVDTIHLMCPNEECEGKMFRRFRGGIGTIKLAYFGTETARTLYKAGYTSIVDLFDKEKFNKEKLIETGEFKEGRTLDALLEEIDKVTIIPFFRVILALGFDGIGHTASKQLARKIAGQTFSFSGLEKKAVDGFEINDPKWVKVYNFKKLLEDRGITIENEIDVQGGIGYEMTGSPSSSGFKTKGDLEKFLGKHGYYHCGLKEAKILLTDSHSSSSGKMSQATLRGVKIMTYTELFSELPPIDENTGTQNPDKSASHSLF